MVDPTNGAAIRRAAAQDRAQSDYERELLRRVEASERERDEEATAAADRIEELQSDLAEMQRRLDRLSRLGQALESAEIAVTTKPGGISSVTVWVGDRDVSFPLAALLRNIRDTCPDGTPEPAHE